MPTSFDVYANWSADYEYGRDEVIKSCELNASASKMQQLTDADRAVVTENLNENVISIVKAHPETTFYFFYPPYSIAHWGMEINNGQLDRTLGAENLILTNAAGGVNLDFKPGDIMLITDHINFMGRNPLVGKNDDSVGTRFPDMSFAYNPSLREIAESCAAKTGTDLKKGVYLGCLGPSYETPAEIRAFRILGADAVGMSTVPEVIAANHCGFKVLAFSLITNMAAGVLKQPLSEEEVLTTGKLKAREMQKLISEILLNL